MRSTWKISVSKPEEKRGLACFHAVSIATPALGLLEAQI
jgi:hypothetical protein